MNKKYKILILALLLLIITACLVFLITGKHSSRKVTNIDVYRNSSAESENDSIVGLWLYIDGTKYEFNGDMTGGMYVGEYKYTYTYSISDHELKINYDNAEVHDSVYEYSFNNGKLKLIGGDGTAGGEYLLDRKQ